MSNFSVGKIVNNSATLILNSDDPKALKSKKEITLNQSKLDFGITAEVTVTQMPSVSVAGGNIVFDNQWFDHIFGLDNVGNIGQAQNIIAGEYWVVTGYQQAVAGQLDWRNVTGFTDPQITAALLLVPAGQDGFIVQTTGAGNLSLNNNGYKLEVQGID
eukprot:SAG11_NODE_2943_length_2820_cov_3.553105_4_plen_159_part_00